VRGLAAPLALAAARVRRRPRRWLLPAVGIALAAAFAAGVAAEAVVAADQSARAALAALSPLDRSVRVSWQGPLGSGTGAQARRLLHDVGLTNATQVALLNPVRLRGAIVRPAAIEPLARWVPGTPHLGACTPADCPMLLVGGGPVPSRLTAYGVNLRVLGAAVLSSAVPLGFSPLTNAEQPVLVTRDFDGLGTLPGLSGVYRTYSWVAPLPVAGLHSWQLASVERRLASAQGALTSTASQFSLDAPFDGLDAARAQASAAPERLLLAGGGALAALSLFILLAGGALRRDQLEELERLRGAGARAIQLVLFIAAESAWLAAVALLGGAALGLIAAAVLANADGEPVAGVLVHSLITPAGAAALLGGWLAAAGLLTCSVLVRSARVADVLAVAAAAALLLALTAGGAERNALALLLVPLCCLAAGVLTYRAASMLLRGGERLARQGPVMVRLALVSLARAPAVPALAIAFTALSIGLGGFALAYRATLIRGASDQAADRVPLDALISSGPDFKTPLEVVSLPRWRVLAQSRTVLPVRRTDANYAAGGATVTVPALGVPAQGLERIHGWRASDGSAPLGVLARRLAPPGPVRTPGPPLAPGWLWVRARSPSLDVTVTADLRDPQGDVQQLMLGTAGARAAYLAARVPSGRWELEALELDEPTGLAATTGHQNAENAGAATQFETRVELGPVVQMPAGGAHARPRPRAHARGGDGPHAARPAPLGAWRAVGAASRAGPALGGNAVVVTFSASGLPGLVRPAQPSDTRPVPVLVDPQTAAFAGPGGRLGVTVDGLLLIARVAGALKRFPTLPPDAAGFVVADQATLASALDAQLPGQGRADELWIGGARLGRLRATLKTGELAASFRADIAASLRSAPLAKGVLGTAIAAAVVSGVLALLGLLTALLGDAQDARVDSDLEAQGIGPRARRAQQRLRVMLAGTLGAWVGAVIAVLLTRLAVASVRAAGAVADPRPPLVAVVPWAQLAVWVFGGIAVLVLAAWFRTAPRSLGRAPDYSARELTETAAR